MFTHQLNPWELDVAPDEELPVYEAASAPAYETGTFDEPVVMFHLRQYDRKIQILRAYGTADTSSYRITTNSFRLFSKKPDMSILHTSKEMRQKNIAVVGFDNDGPLPWCPRAHFDYSGEGGEETTYAMESKNFTDWIVRLGERMYGWTVTTRPCALELREKESRVVIARFTYSACGTQAARGAEVGEMVVFRDALTLEAGGIDKVVCSWLVALTYLKRMGRCYSNAKA
jgi:hypothetical protein